jgi:hypothetical protein
VDISELYDELFGSKMLFVPNFDGLFLFGLEVVFDTVVDGIKATQNH